ncbi:MAG TPA: TonB-dependent receptor [Anaeromyxobacteraceae bacterium]|nr:TonB-dependent receptor [Anaeromyxobacteraceae bacterium]
MRLQRLLRTATLALVFAGSASAQTTGVVIGVVTDTSTGKPIVGALVVASSPSLQGEQTAVTDPSGNYRFDLLPPGQYKIVASLDGYKPFERNDVVVRISKTLKVPMSMVPEAVQLEEQVVRTGQTPVINVGSAETGVTVSKEFIASVPVGRDFSDSALIAPSARADVYGLSFNGATSPENGYVIDGLNVTDPAYGRQGTNMLNNFVDQIDVKTSGFMPEYGRATGGVINMVTKSGSNEFHGSVFGNYTPGSLSPTARTVTANATAVAGQTAIGKQYDTDFGFEVGGPILKDRLWFYAGFAPRLNHVVTDRYYQSLSYDATTGLAKTDATGLTIGTKVGGSDQYFAGNDNQYQITGKLTFLLNENHTFSAMVYAAPGSISNQVATTSAGTPVVNGTDSAILQNFTYGSTDAIGRWAGKFADRRLIVEAVGGWHHQLNQYDPKGIDGTDQASTSQVRWDLTHSLTDFYDNLPGNGACNPTASFTPCPVTRFITGGIGYYDKINLDRFAGRVSASGLVNGGGQHNIKGGIDLERSFYDHTKTYSGGILLRERNSSALGPYFQDYRSYGLVTDTNVDPARVALTVTSVTDSRAYYLQDSYAPIDRLTLNFGLRWETQDMFKQGSTKSNLVINDNIAPRVQAVYDFTGQGRSKVAAHWGRYYEAIPLDMGDRSFGGETQVQASRSHCVDASPTVGGSPAFCPVIPNATFDASSGRLVTYAPYSNAVVPVAPDLKGQYTDQFGGNIEYEVVTDLSIGFEYRGTRLGRVIEDMSVNDGTDFFIANPGSSKPFSIVQSNGQTATVDPRTATTIDPVTLRSMQVAFPKPIREYDGFTFDVRKTFSNHWQGGASYTYSILKGNYAGLFRAENGQLDPNITSEYDLAALMSNRYGPLPNDTPHQFKVYGSYGFEIQPRWSATVGTQIRAISGTPISYLGSHPLYGPSEAFILPRGYGGRTPPVTAVDLQAQTQYTIRAPYTLTFSVAFFNILNSQTATQVDQNYTFDNVLPVANGACKNKNGANATNPLNGALGDCPDLQYLRTTDGRPVTVNPNFGRATAYQLPLSVRFGLALAF